MPFGYYTLRIWGRAAPAKTKKEDTMHKHNDPYQDIREARDTLTRWLQLNPEM